MKHLITPKGNCLGIKAEIIPFEELHNEIKRR